MAGGCPTHAGAASRPSCNHHSLHRALQPLAPRQMMLVGGFNGLLCTEVLGCSSRPHGDPALSHPSNETGNSQRCSWSVVCIAQAPRLGCFYLRFPQIFQFAGPEWLEVALGADPHKFCCFPTPPPTPSLKPFSPPAVPGGVLIPPQLTHSSPLGSLCSTTLPRHSRAGNAATHTKSGIASDPNAN